MCRMMWKMCELVLSGEEKTLDEEDNVVAQSLRRLRKKRSAVTHQEGTKSPHPASCDRVEPIARS